MNPILALSAADYTALAGALVLVIGAISTAAVAIIRALKGQDATTQAQHDEILSKLP